MSLSKNAIVLLDYLSARYGRRVGETEIRAALGVSHGSFVAARRELVERDFVKCEPGGGNRPPIYRAAGGASPCPPSIPMPSGGEALKEAAAMERITGAFVSIDDWIDALTAALGNVDVTECLDGGYAVYSHRHGQSAAYAASLDVNGVTIS